MEREFNIVEGILDALVDDVSSIVQIKEYLKFLGHELNKDYLKDELVKLAEENLIKITYPSNTDVSEFIHSDKNHVVDFWFELTEKGQSEWEKI